ncbi:MAG: hypothetical protein ACR2OF_05660 [Hyphomicrobium sp.]
MSNQGGDADYAALDEFADRCQVAFRRLFDMAKAKEEVQYAMALNPEMRGMQDPGWNTAIEARQTLEDYTKLLEIAPPGTSMRVRVALSLYCHLSEASGFYEVPKNMMRIASGEDYNLWPFRPLVASRSESGNLIAPNATKVMKDLLGHASELELEDLKSIILETFDFDLRNGYAHADYVIWDDGIRLCRRNGGHPKVVQFGDFEMKLNKSRALFMSLQNCVAEAMQAYAVPRRTKGRMNSRQPVMAAIISYSDKGFSIKVGYGL